ncbi:MAG: SPOR domain-containing protein [Candidatus Omnitrophica bacterium]|nr:SPOR domain-containing protein [Candidatus Omnitrophota bacterium]
MRLFTVILFLSIIIFQIPPALASTSAERVEEFFLEGKYDKALMEADKAIDADSGKKYELYYIKGLSALKLNKFAEARKAFLYVTERYPSSERALDSYIGVGDAYFLEGNNSGALRSYKTAADIFADDKNIVVVRQRIADCMAKPGIEERPGEYVETRPAVRPKKYVNFIPKQKGNARIESTVRESASRDSAGQFSVQVGSFKSRSNAAKLASKLSARHYEARLESPSGSSDKLYRVKVGRISSKGEAERLAVKLKREGYPTRVCQED